MVRVKKRVNLYLILSKDIEKGVMKMKKISKSLEHKDIYTNFAPRT